MRRVKPITHEDPGRLFIGELEEPVTAGIVTTLAIGEESNKGFPTTAAQGEEACKGVITIIRE